MLSRYFKFYFFKWIIQIIHCIKLRNYVRAKFVTFWINDLRQAVELPLTLFYFCKIWDNNAFLGAKSHKEWERPQCCWIWLSSKKITLHSMNWKQSVSSGFHRGLLTFQERDKINSSLNQVASDLKQNHVNIFAIWGYKSQKFFKKGKVPIPEFSQFSYLKFEQLRMSPVKTYSEATSLENCV